MAEYRWSFFPTVELAENRSILAWQRGKKKFLNLLHHPGIFMEFAVCQDADTCLAFALKYGQLRDLSEDDCELVREWRNEQTDLAAAIEIVRGIHAGHLADGFRQDRGLWLHGASIIPGTDDADDSFSAAHKYLVQTINRKIGPVSWDVDFMLRPRPHSLLGVIWLQFVDYWLGKSIGQCKECGGWFSKDDGRSEERLFCRNRCKSRNYRKQRQTAIELRQGGLKPREIAAKLGKRLDLVKGWLA